MANIFTSRSALEEEGLRRKGGLGGFLGEVANIILPSKWDFDVYEGIPKDLPQKDSGVPGVQVGSDRGYYKEGQVQSYGGNVDPAKGPTAVGGFAKHAPTATLPRGFAQFNTENLSPGELLAQTREEYGTRESRRKASEILRQAEGLGVINLPEGDEDNLTYFDLKSQQMDEKQEIQNLMSQGYSESDAIKIIGDKFKLKDKLAGMKFSDFGSGRNLRRLFR